MMTDQEQMWAGQFGDLYNDRNRHLVERNVAFFGRTLQRVRYPVKSVLEFGCGTGANLAALRMLCPALNAEGIEVNKAAAKEAEEGAADFVFSEPVSSWVMPPRTWDLVLSKGFLIHIAPENLIEVYRKMVEAAGRYILIAEYYNPTPLEVVYRGETGRMWKRDFATEMLGHWPQSLRVLDYGFVWRNDYPWPQDDITWFLLEKEKH